MTDCSSMPTGEPLTLEHRNQSRLRHPIRKSLSTGESLTVGAIARAAPVETRLPRNKCGIRLMSEGIHGPSIRRSHRRIDRLGR